MRAAAIQNQVLQRGGDQRTAETDDRDERLHAVLAASYLVAQFGDALSEYHSPTTLLRDVAVKPEAIDITGTERIEVVSGP